MNARKLIASLTLFAAAGLAHAADDAPAAAATATATERAGKTPAAANTALLLARANRQDKADVGAAPARPAEPGSAGRSRAEVRAEAVEALKQHRSTLAEDLQLSNN
jgi:hypothetical protein